MANFEVNNEYNCNCNMDSTVISGNSLDLDVNYCESEIRADVIVSEYNSVRLWGRIMNTEGEPVANALLKLIKVKSKGKNTTYTGIAHTVSDCDGFYQFDICGEYDKDEYYKLLVNKAAYGPERVIDPCNGNCNPYYNEANNTQYQRVPIQNQENNSKNMCDADNNNNNDGVMPGYYSRVKY